MYRRKQVRKLSFVNMDPERHPKPPVKDTTLPVTVNGQIPPGGVGRYRFSARPGEQLVVMVRARELIPCPDYELRVTPSSLNVHGGAGVPVTVHALRKDGFTDRISLRLKDPPQGFTLSGAEIPENRDKVRFTLNAAPLSELNPFNLSLEGLATSGGRKVFRAALPADDRMQSFAYRHLVPAQELKGTVTGRFRPGVAARILTATPVRIPAGGTTRIEVTMPVGPAITGAAAASRRYALAPRDPDRESARQRLISSVSGFKLRLRRLKEEKGVKEVKQIRGKSWPAENRD